MTSYECYLRLWSAGTQLFVQLIVDDNHEENIKAPHYWTLVRGISAHKGSVIRKAFPFYTLSGDLRDDRFVWVMNTYNMIKMVCPTTELALSLCVL